MDLKTRAIKSTAWYLVTRLGTQAISWAVTIILARLLTPADYGLFGMAFAVIAFLELFQQLGLGSAIIQRQQMTRQQLNAIFWVVSGASLLAATIAAASAGLVAAFYSEPRLVWMIRTLAVVFLLNAMGMVPYNLLTKEIDFRSRSLAESAGVVASTATSLCLAYLGYGMWALVAGELARATVRNGGMIALCRWFPGLDASVRGMRDIFRFGLNVAGATIFRELSSVANTAIIGRLLGSSALGLYSMAGSLGLNPFHKLSTAVINQLSLPVFSKVQDDLDQLRRYFLKVTKYLALSSLPMQLGMALVSRDLVRVVLSEQWEPIVGLLQVLCVGGIWYVLPLPSVPVLTARGRAQTTLRFYMLSSVTMAVAIFIGAQFGLPGVATAWALSYCLLRTLLLSLSLRELELSFAHYLKNISAPLCASLIMVAAVLGARDVLPVLDTGLHRLIRDIAAGAIAYPAALLLLDRALGGEMRTIVQTIFAGSRA